VDGQPAKKGEKMNCCGQTALEVMVKRLHPDSIIPKYQSAGAAGFDFHAIIDEDNPCYYFGELKVPAKSQCIIKIGIAMSIPKNYELQIRPRSGLAFKKSITVTNSPGTVDCVPAGTDISTPAGNIKVEDLYKNKNACVYSFNEDIKEIEEDIVEDMWIVKDLELLEIETENETVKIPTEKEVYTQDGWKKARDLTTNDTVLLLSHEDIR
jgi:deoxyuridine 5'-triphosphate nucleotidohydrolase